MLVFIQEEAALLSKLSDAFQAVTAEVEVKFPPRNKNTKVRNIKMRMQGAGQRDLKFFHLEVEGRPGEQLEGKFTVEESLRTDMRVVLTTHLKVIDQ